MFEVVTNNVIFLSWSLLNYIFTLKMIIKKEKRKRKMGIGVAEVAHHPRFSQKRWPNHPMAKFGVVHHLVPVSIYFL
jgi:hypothetical protein